ncbi:MAG: GTPase Era [Spirochaetaceae bacterium]|jgi:GTP-binding protein Era|nr:GTPase Era [Spirochaetaceae bacterium]
MTKSAFVAIIGRPSVGKSSLINSLCGSKVSIVSPVPQTTRASIRGIVSRDDNQLVFLDTPGMHLSEKKLNRRLTQNAVRSLAGADIILYLLDSTRAAGPEELEIVRRIKENGEERCSRNIIIAINKIDAQNSDTAAGHAFITEHFPALPAEHIIQISALQKTNLDRLLDLLQSIAPEGPFYYDTGFYTDQNVPFRIAEIIREKCCLLLREELPHSIYVDVVDAQLSGALLNARVFIRCERESQKGMIVGKAGSMLQKIRTAALADLKKIFDWSIKLDIRVKTDKNWRQNNKDLDKFKD